MKFKDVFIERNFRISNDDPYAKERIAATIILDDGEDEQKAMNLARDKMVQNFKAAYPHVRDYMNFEVVEQRNEDTWVAPTIAPIVFKNGVAKVTGEAAEYLKAWDGTDGATYHKPPTLEEQIQACKTREQLLEWRLIAGMNPKTQAVYNEKWASFSNSKTTK